MLLSDLIHILSHPTRQLPTIAYGSELNDALWKMQTLMCRDDNGKQKFESIVTTESRVVPTRN